MANKNDYILQHLTFDLKYKTCLYLSSFLHSTYQLHRLVSGQLVTGPVPSLGEPLGYPGQAADQEERVSIHQTQAVGSPVPKVTVHRMRRTGGNAVHPAAPSSRGKAWVQRWGLPRISPHRTSPPDYPSGTRAEFWTRFAFGGGA